jgi:hypothetical protein
VRRLLRVYVLLALAAFSFLLSACAERDAGNDPNRVSTIPWNRPERWEGQGPLGGMAPNSR